MLSPKTLLVTFHCLGMAMAIGGVMLLDFFSMFVLRRMPIRQGQIEVVRFVSRFVLAGLCMLLVSGLLLLLYYQFYDPAALANPKLHAKLVVVLVLTLNGILVHRIVLNAIDGGIGQRLFENIPPRRRSLMLTVGAVSNVSWYAAFLLGLFRELNFIVPMQDILLGYSTALLAGVLAAHMIFWSRPAGSSGGASNAASTTE